MRLGLAGEVADRRASRSAAAPIDCTISVSRSGSAEHREQALVGRVPGGQPLGARGRELERVDRGAGAGDVAGGEQRVAAGEVQRGRPRASASSIAVERLQRHAVEVAGLLVGEALHGPVGGPAAGVDRLVGAARPTRTRTSGRRGRRGGRRGRRRRRAPRAARRSCGAAGPASSVTSSASSTWRTSAWANRKRPGAPGSSTTSPAWHASAISSMSSVPRTCSTSARSKRRADDRGDRQRVVGARRDSRDRRRPVASRTPSGRVPGSHAPPVSSTWRSTSIRKNGLPEVTSASSRPRARSVLPIAAR